jgi:putative methionine-R-sulfoxide reductase with GAF domain
MKAWSVSSRGLPTVEVRAPNWIIALGQGLEQLGKAQGVERLACEMLQNGTVIARDIASGTGFVVQSTTSAEAPDSSPVDEIFTGDADDDDLPDDDDSSDLPATPERTEELLEVEPDDDRIDGVEEAESLQAACQLALKLSRELVPAESGAIILEEHGYLRFRAVSGPVAKQLAGVRLPLGAGVAGFSMQKRRTVVLNDANEDPRHCGEVDSLTGYTTTQIAVIPIQFGERVFGVLELMNLPGNARFNRLDVHRLQGIAGALGARLAAETSAPSED